MNYLILEDPKVRAVFDAKTGAWIDFQHKPTGWKIQNGLSLGNPSGAYAAWKDRLFNPDKRVKLPTPSVQRSMFMGSKSVSNGISCAPPEKLNWPSASPPKYN